MHLNYRDRLKEGEKYVNLNHTTIRLFQEQNKLNPKDNPRGFDPK